MHLVQPDIDGEPSPSELDYDSEGEEFDDGEIEGMDEDEQNELSSIANALSYPSQTVELTRRLLHILLDDT